MNPTPDDILDALLDARLLVREGCTGTATDVFHPQYGCLIKDGEPTEAGKQFYEDLMNEFK